MGREESKEYILNLIRVDGDNDDWIKSEYVLSLVDRIYDEFENNTCSNCKFYNDSMCMNPEVDNMADSVPEMTENINVYETFGCNRFEEKLVKEQE